MSAADFLAEYGAGLGGVCFVAVIALLCWYAGRRADARRAVAAAAEPLMTLRAALRAAGSDKTKRLIVGDAFKMRYASDVLWEREHQALLARDSHPPG